MLLPVLVISLGVVIARVRASRLLSRLGRDDGLVGAREQVAQLERFDEVAVSMLSALCAS